MTALVDKDTVVVVDMMALVDEETVMVVALVDKETGWWWLGNRGHHSGGRIRGGSRRGSSGQFSSDR